MPQTRQFSGNEKKIVAGGEAIFAALKSNWMINRTYEKTAYCKTKCSIFAVKKYVYVPGKWQYTITSKAIIRINKYKQFFKKNVKKYFYDPKIRHGMWKNIKNC